ncbi:MAG TPA: cell division protein FtsA [bacterium]|nr:cell division protein FtsA [bacterium]HPS28906.1 cell division protein FtsA [bacterium]
MKKNIETALKTVLSSEQIAVLKEEITTGIRRINTAVDNNEKMKAKKDLMIETFIKIDELIEKSDRAPLIFKSFYAIAKSNIRKLIQPILEEMMEEEQIKNLDDIPDVKTTEKKNELKEETVEKKEEKKEENPSKPAPDRKRTFHKNNSGHRPNPNPKPKPEAKPAEPHKNFNRKDSGKNHKER